MIWQGTTLVDAPTPVSFTEGELVVGGERLRLTSDNPADIRAVAEDGRAFRLRKAGLTVSRYEALCDGRPYTARRTGGSRREITDGAGTVVARTHGRPDGSLEVRGDFTLDLTFITWGLTYVDTPTRRTRR